LAGLPSAGRCLPLQAADATPEAIIGAGTRGWFVRSGERKLLIPFPERTSAAGAGEQLFAVSATRCSPETDDLAATEPGQREALLERWRAWRAEAGEDRLGALDPATEQALRALGYLR
jgi:hypothetical protein